MIAKNWHQMLRLLNRPSIFCCRNKQVIRSLSSSGQVKTANKPWPSSPYDEYPDNYLSSLASATDEEMDQLLGPKILRATQVEAAVRMLADYFLVYDAMDRTFLDEKLRREFEFDGEGDGLNSSNNASAGGDVINRVNPSESASTTTNIPVEIDQSLIDQMTDSDLLQAHEFALKEFSVKSIKNIDDYLEMTAYNIPRYTVSDHKKIYTDLFVALNHFKPGFLKGVSDQLLSSDGVPNIEAFHLMIRQLTECRYTKPAQMALDCLYLSDIPLTLETFSLAVRLSVVEGDFGKFMAFVSSIRPGAVSRPAKTERSREILKKGPDFMLKTMSSSATLPGWPETQSSNQPAVLNKFTRNCNSPSTEEMPFYTSVLTHIAEGFCKFGLYDNINLVIVEMIRLDILNKRVLSFNLRAVDIDKDPIRARWTINEFLTNKDLVLVRDEKNMERAKRIARKVVKDMELYHRLKQFNDTLPCELNPAEK